METQSDFKASKWLVPGCTSDTIFNKATMYRAHIRKVHKIFGKDIDPHMPYKKKDKFVPTKCRVDGCASRATFSLPNRYKAHLRDYYEMEEDEIEFYVDGG
jgi:hypothetical protein